VVQPDFIIIPTELYQVPGLWPVDYKLMGYIIWLTKLKGGKCIASNQTLAELCGVDARTIRRALARLEVSGWIARAYKTPNRKDRVEITALKGVGQLRPTVGQLRPMGRTATPYPTAGEVGQLRPQNKSIKREHLIRSEKVLKVLDENDYMHPKNIATRKAANAKIYKPKP
jgi:DNA-binding transcriptional MocR family regulator